MKSIRCPSCKQEFPPPERGRRSTYCSAACRQKAYRKRMANPMVRLFLSDYQGIKDRENRKKAAVKTLEDLGYIVYLERGKRSILPQRPKPKLTVIEPEP